METIPAIEAASTIATDPTLTIIASAFGGAILTGIVGLITYLLNARREHAKWLRDLKFRTYADKLTRLEHLHTGLESTDSDESSGQDGADDWSTAMTVADLDLVASPEVTAEHMRVVATIASYIRNDIDGIPNEMTAFRKSLLSLTAAMRKDIGMR